MAFLGFITAGVAAVFLIVGVLGLLSARVRTILRGIPVANKILDPMTWSIVFIAIGLFAGGFGVVGGYFGDATASITGTETGAAITSIGGLSLKVHDGVANATTTEDYYNDDDTFLTFYSADASIADGEEYKWNITIDRERAVTAAVVTVSCSIPDKEISGITADNLAQKTGGQIELDINDAGRHSDDNTVYKAFAMAEGVITQEVEVAFDQMETYHDGMSDLDDYVDAVCTVTGDDGTSASVTTRIYADN